MNLAKNLKVLRKKRGWSQSQLAEQIGSHLSHINRIETGKYNPSLDVVQKLASAFDVSIDFLISDTDEDFKEVRVENKELMERVKLIDSLDVEDKTALIRVIDSMLTKKKIMNLVTKENTAEHAA
ncbi:MAG: helix-turn-helix transcriptional regulator [Pseudomonadota bacterium]